MFMNKISTSQTCLYNFSYKKATCTRYLQQPVTYVYSCFSVYTVFC